MPSFLHARILNTPLLPTFHATRSVIRVTYQDGRAASFDTVRGAPLPPTLTPVADKGKIPKLMLGLGCNLPGAQFLEADYDTIVKAADAVRGHFEVHSDASSDAQVWMAFLESLASTSSTAAPSSPVPVEAPHPSIAAIAASVATAITDGPTINAAAAAATTISPPAATKTRSMRQRPADQEHEAPVKENCPLAPFHCVSARDVVVFASKAGKVAPILVKMEVRALGARVAGACSLLTPPPSSNHA
jgi:hypothetical protein